MENALSCAVPPAAEARNPISHLSFAFYTPLRRVFSLFNPIAPTTRKSNIKSGPAMPQGRFVFEKKVNAAGREILHFPFMSISDVHWGTMVSRARRLADMLYNTEADLLYGLGDMIDLEYLRHKRRWNIGPWHRQGIAHLLRKTEEGSTVLYFRGNHETGMRSIEDDAGGAPSPIWRDGTRQIFGIPMVYDHSRTDAKGRSIHAKHGDIYDYVAMRSEKIKPLVDWLAPVMGDRGKVEQFIYTVFSQGYESLYGIDWGLRKLPRLENYSFAAHFKHFFKEKIMENLGVRKMIAQALDESPHDVMIYGHSHMPGFEWTPAGKLLINDGCSTEHVNLLVQDKNGVFALLTWHRWGVEIEEEPQAPGKKSLKYIRSWEDLGVPHFQDHTPPLEDIHSLRADRLLRLAYRLAPPLQRNEAQQSLMRKTALLEKFHQALALGYNPDVSEIMAAQRMMTHCRQEEEKIRRMDTSLPRPDLS